MTDIRPQPMIWFDWVYWSAVVVGFAGEVFFNGLDPEFIVQKIIVLSLMAFVWYMIAQRVNNIFRWIFTILVFIGIGFFGLAFLAYNFELGVAADISAVQLWFSGISCTLKLCGVICLFMERSQIWFESKR